MKRTYSQKPSEISRKWHLIDADGVAMGRVATVAARLLLGKDKPTVTHHMDGGDFVIIVNADKIGITGGKEDKKFYYNYSGYPSGLRKRSLRDIDNTEALQHAIRGMLPANKLRDGRLARLKIFGGAEHAHTAQTPVIYELKGKL